MCIFAAKKRTTKMLAKFSVKNYRGFAKKIEWDLSKPSNYEFNQFAIKDGIIKNGIIYGPNGSGKTNFGLAIFDIVNHLSQKWKRPGYYDNFVYAGKTDVLVEFEYEFLFDSAHLVYTYEKNHLGVLSKEKLVANSEVLFERNENGLFIEKFKISEQIKAELANNANGVSIVNFIISSYPLDESHYLIQLKRFVDSMLWYRSLEDRGFIGIENSSGSIDEYIIRNNLVKDFETFIKEISGQPFKIAEPDPSDKRLFYVVEDTRLPFIGDYISTGTSTLKLFFYWYKHIEQCSFVLIDEFDAFYHFDLSWNVCKLLFSSDCQSFVTTHNTLLMTNDMLRPDCNFIIKNNTIESLTNLTDKELRLGHNIEKLYRGGAFN